MIYIDFEQLGTSDATPALLGVLTTHHDTADRFTSYVVEPRLAGAAVASRACRAANLATAMTEILAQAGAIVSWSAHDLRVIQKADVPAGLIAAVEARWLDARKDVKRWKNRLYPDAKLPALGAAEGHALKIYMQAVGYTVSPALAPGKAASWLRHVLDVLEAHGGRYRAVSSRTKRHWHSLLEYNRHDCFGLHAVYERAARELRLEQAYRQTTYHVKVDDASHRFRVGRQHYAMDTALRAARASRWACITAHNPQSQVQSARENQRRDFELKETLRARNIRWYPTAATSDLGDWPAESGVLALGVSRGLAESIGRDFDQAAVVWGRLGGAAELVWCNRLF